MSILVQGWGDPFAPLTGGYGAPLPAWAQQRPSGLEWSWWWQSVSAWPRWPAAAAPAPALWWCWWWAAPEPVPAHAFSSARALAHGVYRYQSSGGGPMGATPTGTTPRTVTLRTHDKFVPFSVSFAPDVASSDSIVAATVIVTQQAAGTPRGASSDVTSSLLMGQTQSGTTVTAVLANANVTLGSAYKIRVIAVMASGLVLEETIGDGQPTHIICDS